MSNFHSFVLEDEEQISRKYPNALSHVMCDKTKYKRAVMSQSPNTSCHPSYFHFTRKNSLRRKFFNQLTITRSVCGRCKQKRINNYRFGVIAETAL